MRGSQFLAVTALSLATAGAAVAGGPVAVEPEPVIVVAPVVPAWQGGYVGGTLGYAFGGDDRIGLDMAAAPYANFGKYELSGVNYGLRAGYRWQRERWVFGPELSVEGGDISDDFDEAGYSGDTELKRAIALRWKTGYVLESGKSMVYGIVGASNAKFDYSVTGTSAEHGPADVDTSYTKTGYVVGFGLEHKLSETWSLTGEYEYASYGKKRLFDDAGNSTQSTPKFHNVKLGVNFSF